MILKETILSVFNERGTLLQWLKKVEKLLKESTLLEVKVEKINDTESVIKLVFEDNTIQSAPFELDADITQKLERALVTPINRPQATEIVAVNNNGAQEMLGLGAGLSIDNGLLNAVGGGSGGSGGTQLYKHTIPCSIDLYVDGEFLGNVNVDLICISPNNSSFTTNSSTLFYQDVVNEVYSLYSSITGDLTQLFGFTYNDTLEKLVAVAFMSGYNTNEQGEQYPYAAMAGVYITLLGDDVVTPL